MLHLSSIVTHVKTRPCHACGKGTEAHNHLGNARGEKKRSAFAKAMNEMGYRDPREKLRSDYKKEKD